MIDYLKTDNEKLKKNNTKNENSYECKIIGTTEQKLRIIKQIERDYNFNIKNDIINNHSTEIEFNTDFYKLIVNVFQTREKLPKLMSDVVNLYIYIYINVKTYLRRRYYQ